MTKSYDNETYSTCPSSAGSLSQRSANDNKVRLRAKWWEQRQKAGKQAMDTFTAFTMSVQLSVQFEPDGSISQRWPSVQNQFETCGEHLSRAAASTNHDDFAEHYSEAFQNLKQIGMEWSKSASLCKPKQSQLLTSLFKCVADLSRAAYDHLNEFEGSAEVSENHCHEYWVGRKRLREMRTDYEKAIKEYSAKFRIDTHSEAYPTSPLADRLEAAVDSIGLDNNATTTTRRASEELAESDLEHALGTIRKLVPSAGGMTNEELKEHLFARYTAGSKASGLSVNVEKTSSVAEKAEESIFRRHQMPTIDVSAADITSPTRQEFRHTQTALNVVSVLDNIKEFMNKQYDGGEDESRKEKKARIETALSNCRDSVQRIGATDNFFLLSENFSRLHDQHDRISHLYRDEFEPADTIPQECELLDADLTKKQLKLSRQAVSTLYQGEVASDLFSQHTHASRHFWGDGRNFLEKMKQQIEKGKTLVEGPARDEAKEREAQEQIKRRKNNRGSLFYYE